jgi:ubiquitin-like protein Pup
VAQEQKQKTKARSEEHVEETEAVSGSAVSEAAGETVDKIDEVLEDQLDDEILSEMDDVLESNAEEFVAAFVQQGGE